MKIKTQTLVLLLVALVFGGGVWVWERFYAPSEIIDASTEMGDPIFDFSEDDIAQIEIQTADLAVTFGRSADMFPQVWMVESPVQGAADEAAIAFLLSQLTTGRRDRTLSVAAEQLADFGLKTPVATVTVTLRSQERHRLLLGDADFNRSFVYARIDPSDAASADSVEIDLIPIGLLDAVDRPLAEWEEQPTDSAPASSEPTVPETPDLTPQNAPESR